jgi:hypothetical protein
MSERLFASLRHLALTLHVLEVVHNLRNLLGVDLQMSNDTGRNVLFRQLVNHLYSPMLVIASVERNPTTRNARLSNTTCATTCPLAP